MKYYCFPHRVDGFGAQFQTFVYSILFCEKNNLNFVYRDIKTIEHNYANDPKYIHEIEELMNIKNNYTTEEMVPSGSEIIEFQFNKLINLFDKNMDLYMFSTGALQKLKRVFWENKNKNCFNNGKINVAIHIRRYITEFDVGYNRPQVPAEYYADIMDRIRAEHSNVLFHIYSIGDDDFFKVLMNEDVVFHINENISKTFTEMVAADILVTSRSSFSHVAAILSDGIIYYVPFWHPPAKHWIVC